MPHRPIILGVVGDSAAGKTTLTAGIASILGAEQVTTICSDDYHRYNREQRKQLDITALHPDCNYIDIMEQHLRCLAEGEPILKPVYNHRTGDFDAPVYVEPKPFVVVEGLLAFATPRLRERFHVKVYLDPPEELRHVWKVRRDTAKRGYTPAQVLAELAKRASDSAEFIRPQRGWSDLVARFSPPAGALGSEQGAQPVGAKLTLRSTLPHPDLSDVVASSPALKLQVGRDEGRLAEFLDIDGQISATQADAVEAVVWSHLPALERSQAQRTPLRPEQLGTFVDGQEQRQSHPLGLTQLLIAYHLLLARLEKETLHAKR